MARKTTRLKMFKGEKVLWLFLILLIFGVPVMIVFSKATLSKTNIEVSRLKYDIKSQEAINDTLTMKINELASLDKIQALARELGLSYNNNNIKVINDR